MYIIGTAGHVDHGKSALVQALTGVDPDRLPEEKRRAMTIELGFASYHNEAGQTIGVVDVPGHERFIRNMVAGTWALDCALLVIASDDGWMQQTEDHAQVLKGMHVPLVFVVVTKADLADHERLKTVQTDASARFTAIFGYKPEIVVTSASTQGGISELKKTIDRLLATLMRRKNLPPCLYIDRSFNMNGIGQVVTGSLRRETLSIGDEVTILPQRLRARVRSLQTFGNRVEHAGDGTRTAVGLHRISSEQLHRGDCLTRSPATFTVGSHIFLLIEHPYANQELEVRNHAQLEIASGTWHDTCSVHLLGRQTQSPGLARVMCKHEHAWYWRQPLIIMHPGSSSIAAFGTVLSANKLGKSELERLRTLIQSDRDSLSALDDEEYLRLLLTGFGRLVHDHQGSIQLCGMLFEKIGRWHATPEIIGEVEQYLLCLVDRGQPVPLEEAKQHEPYPAALMTGIIERMVRSDLLELKGGMLASVKQDDLPKEAQRLLAKIEHAGLCGFETKALAREEKPVIGILLQKELIVILDGSFIYSLEMFRQITSLVLQGRKIGDLISIADAKAHLPLSRKYMIPILNQMEREKFLMRIGDARRILKLQEGI